MDLSKAYKCLPHDHTIHYHTLFHLWWKENLIKHQKVSKYYDHDCKIPQGSILVPLIFNIFINDLIMFIEKTNICNFVDDNILNKSSPSLLVVLNCLEHECTIVLNWFKVNSLKPNTPPKISFYGFRRKKSFR